MQGIALVILFEKVWSMDVLDRLPGVVAFGVPFPLHKVLERSGLTMMSMVNQVFNLVFFSTLD